MATRLTGKVAIVTGSGQGIGRAMAIAFAREGAIVVIATRTAAHGEETLRLIRGRRRQGDASGRSISPTMTPPAPWSNEAAAAAGRLDIMVHNAAAFGRSSIEEMDQATLDRLFNVNVKACFTLTQASLPHMRKQGAGRIIITSSVTGPKVSMPGSGAYASIQSRGHRLYPYRGHRTGAGQHHGQCH